jgi:hypothetical protein
MKAQTQIQTPTRKDNAMKSSEMTIDQIETKLDSLLKLLYETERLFLSGKISTEKAWIIFNHIHSEQRLLSRELEIHDAMMARNL